MRLERLIVIYNKVSNQHISDIEEVGHFLMRIRAKGTFKKQS